MDKTLLVLTGPTASGKTTLAFEIASEINTHIISSDSRQLYKELKIGVARPPEEYLQRIPHHFIASHSMFEPLSAGQYAIECRKKIEELFQFHDILIMTGGSGLYISSVLYGLDERTKVNEKTRNYFNELRKQKGDSYLRELLKSQSSEWYHEIDHQNPARVQRALEILHDSPGSSPFQKKNVISLPYHVIIYVLNEDRKTLYARINQRVQQMINEGLKDEAMLWKSHQNLQVLRTVGYREWFAYPDKRDEWIIEKIQQNTRHYAKKQLTWFRHQLPNATWIHPHEKNKILKSLKLH